MKPLATPPPDIVEALVASVLAVNSYSLEKAWALVQRLREAGLTDPAQVATLDIGTITVRLASSGYDRGFITGILAERVKDLMNAMARGQLDELPGAIAQKDARRASTILETVRGVGPKVVQNAMLLLDVAQP